MDRMNTLVTLMCACNEPSSFSNYSASAAAPVMNATEVLLFFAIVAQHKLIVFKPDTKQALFNGDIGPKNGGLMGV